MKLMYLTVALIAMPSAWSQKIIQKVELKKIEVKTTEELQEPVEQQTTISDPINLELEVNELLNGEKVDINITETNGEKSIRIKSETNGNKKEAFYIGSVAAEVHKIIENRDLPFNQSEPLPSAIATKKIKQKRVIKTKQ
jgi:hypothetical protein